MAGFYSSTHASLVVTPHTPVTVFDFPDNGNGRVVGIDLADGSLSVQFSGGNAEQYAGLGVVIDALEQARGNVRARLAAESRMPVLPDGLEAATLADALKGMAPGEIQEVFGS